MVMTVVSCGIILVHVLLYELLPYFMLIPAAMIIIPCTWLYMMSFSKEAMVVSNITSMNEDETHVDGDLDLFLYEDSMNTYNRMDVHDVVNANVDADVVDVDLDFVSGNEEQLQHKQNERQENDLMRMMLNPLKSTAPATSKHLDAIYEMRKNINTANYDEKVAFYYKRQIRKSVLKSSLLPASKPYALSTPTIQTSKPLILPLKQHQQSSSSISAKRSSNIRKSRKSMNAKEELKTPDNATAKSIDNDSDDDSDDDSYDDSDDDDDSDSIDIFDDDTTDDDDDSDVSIYSDNSEIDAKS